MSQFAKNSIDINQNGIEKILLALVKKRLIVEGSTLIRSEILENETRQEIYSYICDNPGKYITQLENELDLGRHSVVWHLKTLLNFNFIEKQEFDNHELYYKSGLDFSFVKINYLTFKNGKILNYLRENNIGLSKTRLSRDLNMSMTTMDKNLKYLIENDIVRMEYIDNTYLYFLNNKTFSDKN